MNSKLKFHIDSARAFSHFENRDKLSDLARKNNELKLKHREYNNPTLVTIPREHLKGLIRPFKGPYEALQRAF